MRVALVHDFLTQYGGAEKVLEAFLELWPDATIFVLVKRDEIVKQFFNRYKDQIISSFVQKMPFAEKNHQYYLPLMPYAAESLNRKLIDGEFDIVISDTAAFVKGSKMPGNIPHLSYIHTPTRWLWEETKDYIKNTKSIARYGAYPFIPWLRRWDFNAAQKPTHFATNSRFVRDKIEKYYQRNAEVIHPPTDIPSIEPANKEEIKDYYLIISRLEPYKKIDIAIQAFNILGLPLKIIGVGSDARLRMMADYDVEFLGFVPDEKKWEYLRHCRALIYPQIEDLGITAIEAMAVGRPVIAYRAGGAIETIIEGKTGEFFNEQTPRALADAVRKFDWEQYDPAEIRAHALKFSKERFKEKITAFIQKIVGKR